MRQSQPLSTKQEPRQSYHLKLERNVNRSSGYLRSRVSSSVSNFTSGHHKPTLSILPKNSSSQAASFTVTDISEEEAGTTSGLPGGESIGLLWPERSLSRSRQASSESGGG
ncbi:hypothetical protein Droror1_Dr00025726 [Drosera rotundifolia]